MNNLQNIEIWEDISKNLIIHIEFLTSLPANILFFMFVYYSLLLTIVHQQGVYGKARPAS